MSIVVIKYCCVENLQDGFSVEKRFTVFQCCCVENIQDGFSVSRDFPSQPGTEETVAICFILTLTQAMRSECQFMTYKKKLIKKN